MDFCYLSGEYKANCYEHLIEGFAAQACVADADCEDGACVNGFCALADGLCNDDGFGFSGVLSGAPEGIITSFPCTTHQGDYAVVTGLEIDQFSRAKIDASWAELVEERDTVAAMGMLG